MKTKLKNTDEKKWDSHCETAHTQELRCDYHCNPEKQGDDWESRFDERFNTGGYWRKEVDIDEVKDFIRQLEKQTRESVIESEKDYWFNKGCAFAFHCCDCGYCQEKEQEYRLKMDKLKQKTKE